MDNESHKSELIHSVAENTTLRQLCLSGKSHFTVAVLHGVAGNSTVEDLELWGELIGAYYSYHDNSVIVFHLQLITCSLSQCVVSGMDDEDEEKALVTICGTNTKLRSVAMKCFSSLPVMKSLTTRQVPLEELEIHPYVVC